MRSIWGITSKERKRKEKEIKKKERRKKRKQTRIRSDDVGEDNHVQEARLFPVYLASFFLSTTHLDEQCSNLSLENPKLMNRSQNSP